jgi:hypothetical protein
MLQNSMTLMQSTTAQPPIVFSRSEVTPLGFANNPSVSTAPHDGTVDENTHTKQTPVVFSQSESIPLGFTNKLLRKAAYGFGITSFLLTGLSGISSKNYWRTASGFGSAGINIASLLMPERDDALPNASIPGQMTHSILHPQENTLFFNRSSTFITDIMKFAAGLNSARKTEVMEGVWKIATKAIDIAGISDQDRREKLALKEGKDVKDVSSPLRKIFANRFVSLTSSAVAAGLQIAQGMQHNDKKMTVSGIFYFLAVTSLFADNIIMEEKIKKADGGRSR